jgi:predicted transposase/invertase (TIGR01784 family)
MQLLDPKLDVVFKLLFAHPNHRDILISLLTAVLQPTVPIADATVLNPEIPKDLPDDKGTVLDIRVQLTDGRQIDVEMQSALHPGLIQRILYYNARLLPATRVQSRMCCFFVHAFQSANLADPVARARSAPSCHFAA